MLRFRGPYGSFYLREESTKPMLLIAGGTGFGPIKAIVEQAIAEKSTRRMDIYWGGRQRADLYLLPVAESWALAQPNIRFVPVLSDPPQEGFASERWRGRTGLVHAVAIQDFPDLSRHQVYVCGSPAMVAAARRDFVGSCALPEDEFFADAFEFANDDLAAAAGPSLTAG
jgi:CDP-4-dehydro-6-deoxyglucose reductase